MIRLENVTRAVTSSSERLTILDNVNLFVPAGQFIAVTGASGSGKSTLLSIVAGLDAPTSGDVYLAQQRITAMPEDALADLRGAMIGFVFQSFHLIPSLTALENVMVPMELADQPDAAHHADLLIDEVGLRDRAHHYPSQLSGGEQQRVAIARAFANRPSILLADEPTGNLDTANGAKVFELLVRLNRGHGTTLMLVTHETGLALSADRRIVLSAGRIVADEDRCGLRGASA
ncbi:MAG TPA: ABC transporter ATP-binding protein [Vicinamibacterales bacterium]